jgi:hypothetical protein
MRIISTYTAPDESTRFPVPCTCGHAEGDHEDGPNTPCMVPDCECRDFVPAEG